MSTVTLELGGNAKEVIEGFNEAANSVEKLNSEVKDLDNTTKKTFSDTTKGAKEAGKAIDENTSKRKKQIGIIEKIEEDLKKLRKARKEANNTEGIKKLNKEIDEQENKLNKLTGTTKKVGLSFKDLAKGALTFIGITAAIDLVKGAFTRVIGVVGDYDQATSQLKAITGLDAKQFIPFNKAIKDVASNTSRSAVEVAKAFQLIGSAQPELLKSASALAAVTNASITLAKAGGIDVPTAAASLTKAMNQFGASASDAAKFTDILATSQQKGTATISQLSESLKNVGAVANAAGVDFEQTNVLLQALAKGGLTGSEAGTGLKTALAKLAAQSRDDLNPTLTNTTDIINTLANENLSLVEANKLVGEEGGKALLTLIAQKDVVNGLTGALNEQNNAQEQAATATDNIKDKYIEFQANVDNLIISIEDGSGAFGSFAKSGLDIVNGLFPLIESGFQFIIEIFSDVGDAIFELADAFGLVSTDAEETFGVMDAIGKVMQFVGIQIKTAINVIVALIKGLSLLVETGKQVVAFFSGEGFDTATIEDAAKSFGDSILKIGDDQKNGMKKLIDGSIDLTNKSVAELRKIAEDAVANRDTALIKEIKREVQRRKDLQKQNQDILIEAANGESEILKEASKKLTDDQKKAAEKRAKELLAIEKKYQDDLTKLADEAEKQRISELSGVDLFEAQEKQRNKEIDLIKSNLEEQRKVLGLEKELEKEQLDQIQLLRDIAARERASKKLKFNEDELKANEEIAEKSLDLQEQILIEQTIAFEEKLKQIKILEIQRDFAQKRIEDLGTNLSEEDKLLKLQLENQKTDISNQIDELNQLDKKFSLAKLLGVTDEEFENIRGALGVIGQEILASTQDLFAQQQQANEDLIVGINDRIDEVESELDRELELQEQGFASNVEGKQAELAALKLEGDKAQKEQEKLAKRQFALDTALQASALITSAANIIKATSSIPPPFGPIIAAASIAIITGLFISSKVKAFKAISKNNSSQKLEKGGKLDRTRGGRKHGKEGGNRIGGTDVEVEMDEWVINSKTSNEHDKFLERMNAGEFSGVNLDNLLNGTGVSLNKNTPKKVENKKMLISNNTAKRNAEMTSNKMVDIMSSMDFNLEEFFKFTKNKKQIVGTPWGRIEIDGDTQTNIKMKGIE